MRIGDWEGRWSRRGGVVERNGMRRGGDGLDERGKRQRSERREEQGRDRRREKGRGEGGRVYIMKVI